jgi:hypothetical protein
MTDEREWLEGLSIEAQEDEERIEEERRKAKADAAFDAGFAEYEDSLRVGS